MNTPTISMQKDVARELYDQYRRSLQARGGTAEDEAVARGYKALADGKVLIDLQAALRSGGLNEKNLPRLAVARAHWQWCEFCGHSNGSVTFCKDRVFIFRTGVNTANKIRIPTGTFPSDVWHAANTRALVPLIPLPLRPTTALEKYHILWEAVWEPSPPVDPILLRHLHGRLYVVVAQWDLTELERAVLAGRLR